MSQPLRGAAMAAALGADDTRAQGLHSRCEAADPNSNTPAMFKRLAARPYLGTCVPGDLALGTLGTWVGEVAVRLQLWSWGRSPTISDPSVGFASLLQEPPGEATRSLRGIILRQKPS